MRPFFLDNTNSDGNQVVLQQVSSDLGRTWTIVTSKFGGTIETSKGMKEANAAYEIAGLEVERYSVAITQEASKLDNLAKETNRLDRSRIWEWFGGRTSEFSAVGLLPVALQGTLVDQLLSL